MPCQTFRDDQGKAIGIVCGPRARAPRCSSPGCRKASSLECDAPVEKAAPALPHRGDARLHRQHRRIFYVHRVDGDQLTIALHPPGERCLREPQVVSVADWFAKTSATCNQPICSGCAVRIGTLDVCKAHGRELEGKHHE